jgi:glycosyltransferase involved in cell wall biosynthesis
MDTEHEGAWVTRNRAAAAVRTEWTAFLDDDDELLPIHVEHLLSVAAEHQADVVWGWFRVVGGGDPFPHYRGKQYDPAQPHVVPITYMVRTELLRAAVERMGGFMPDTIGAWDNQDMPLLSEFAAQGGRMVASPETTWVWHHHGANTSGLPTRWR